MGTRRRVGMSYSCRVLSGFACAVALVLGLLSLLDPPAQAATGAGTWSLDAAPGQLGFGEVDAISCADPTYCVALSSNQYEDDALIDSNGSWSSAPLVEPGGALQLNSVSCFSESFCMAVGESSLASGGHPNAGGVIEEWDGSAWSVVSNPQSSGLDVSFSSVSCPGAASCLAVGQDSTDGGFIDSWNGLSWTMAFNEQGVSLSAVSCSTPASCVAVGAGASNLLYSRCWSAEPGRPNLCPTRAATPSFTTCRVLRQPSVWQSARYKSVASAGRPVLPKPGTAHRGLLFRAQLPRG